jgi:hypothetical protein
VTNVHQRLPQFLLSIKLIFIGDVAPSHRVEQAEPETQQVGIDVFLSRISPLAIIWSLDGRTTTEKPSLGDLWMDRNPRVAAGPLALKAMNS